MFPCLVRESALNADVVVSIASEGISEDGEVIKDFEVSTRCNINLKSYTKLTADKQLVNISGKAMFIGDLCPDINIIKGGSLTYNGEKYNIFKAHKYLNFDGTVNCTELELE